MVIALTTSMPRVVDPALVAALGPSTVNLVLTIAVLLSHGFEFEPNIHPPC